MLENNERLAKREQIEPVCASEELQVESSDLVLQPHSIGTKTELSSEDVSYMEFWINRCSLWVYIVMF